MGQVLKWTAQQAQVSFTDQALTGLVGACHGTARHAVRLIEATIDTIMGDDQFLGRSLELIEPDVVQATLDRLGYRGGLTAPEFDLLGRLASAPNGKLGLNTLASVLDEESRTVEQVYEPYLLQKGFITKTTNGRQITKAGQEFIQSIK
jgi:Holliday junction DNA helicase RuvB